MNSAAGLEAVREESLPESEGKRPRVYLAGPIDNVDDTEASEWRRDAAAVLRDAGIEPVDPYERFPKWPVTRAGQIELRERCFEWARDCDAVLVGNLTKDVTSRGTSMEVREAETAGTPVVVHAPALDVSNMIEIPARGVHSDLDVAISDSINAATGVEEAIADD